jgi:hypothetical protein
MPPRKSRADLPSVRFVGGGLHGQVAPGALIDKSVDYRAWRKPPCTSHKGPQYDLYRWDPNEGTMRYVGTVKDMDGPAHAVLTKASIKWAKEHPLPRPQQWDRQTK